MSTLKNMASFEAPNLMLDGSALSSRREISNQEKH
jgi:hypothetical protein